MGEAGDEATEGAANAVAEEWVLGCGQLRDTSLLNQLSTVGI